MTTETQEFQGMSDDDLEHERTAQKWERLAYQLIERAQQFLKDAAGKSELKRQDLLDYANALRDCQADYSISTQQWNEAISEARDVG